jgi:hypothetical protein
MTITDAAVEAATAKLVEVLARRDPMTRHHLYFSDVREAIQAALAVMERERMATPVPVNSPFDRVPQCACDPGTGEPPSKLKQLECKARGGPCSGKDQGPDAITPSTPPPSSEAAECVDALMKSELVFRGMGKTLSPDGQNGERNLHHNMYGKASIAMKQAATLLAKYADENRQLRDQIAEAEYRAALDRAAVLDKDEALRDFAKYVVDEHENLEDRAPVEPKCGECNMGAGPHIKTCMYHRARAALSDGGK